MRSFWIAVAFVAMSSSARAQAITAELPADALNAVLRFRGDLSADSTHIARCRLDQVGDSSSIGKRLDERFRQLLVLPPGWTGAGSMACAVHQFARMPHPTLWVQSVVELQRKSESILPYPERLQYEITVQWLVNASYREYHRYLVVPSVKFSESGAISWGDFRVVEYKLLGADHHWGDNAGHGSSVRRP